MPSQFTKQNEIVSPSEVDELVQRLTHQPAPTEEPSQISVKDVAEVTGVSDIQVAHELEKMRLERRIQELEEMLSSPEKPSHGKGKQVASHGELGGPDLKWKEETQVSPFIEPSPWGHVVMVILAIALLFVSYHVAYYFTYYYYFR